MGSINLRPPWGAVSQTEYRRFAKDGRHPMAYRVHFAALGWANLIGHAEFAPGELGRILSNEAGRARQRSGVSQAIKAAKALDLVHASSGARCLVLAVTTSSAVVPDRGHAVHTA